MYFRYPVNKFTKPFTKRTVFNPYPVAFLHHFCQGATHFVFHYMYNPAQSFTVTVFVTVYKKQDGCNSYNKKRKYTYENNGAMYLTANAEMPVIFYAVALKPCPYTGIDYPKDTSYN